MTKYYEVQRTRTCKTVGKAEPYYMYDRDVKQFATIADVKKFLRDEYGTCKRQKIYRDRVDTAVELAVDESNGVHGADHVGYIYCYNTPKCSYDDTAKNNQDWIECKEIRASTVIIR